MSMIMRVARGSARDLERLADDDGDDGSIPPVFQALASNQLAALGSLAPERLEQMEAMLRANPQFAALAPQVMERLRGMATAAPAAGSAGGSGATGRRRSSRAAKPETIDLHKSWHILHFLFTGRAGEGGSPPANLFLEGGREVGEDQGYGPARLLDPAETAAFARFAGSLTVEVLSQRIDPAQMAALGIYCAGDGSRADANEMQEDLARYFPPLQAHFQAAAEAGQSTLVWLT